MRKFLLKWESWLLKKKKKLLTQEKTWWNCSYKKQELTYISCSLSHLSVKSWETDADSSLQLLIVVLSTGLKDGQTKLFTQLLSRNTRPINNVVLKPSLKNFQKFQCTFTTQLSLIQTNFTLNSEERTTSLQLHILSFWNFTSKWWNISKVCFQLKSRNIQSALKHWRKLTKKSPNFNKKLLKCSPNLNSLPSKLRKWWSNFKDKPKLRMKHKHSALKIPMKLKVKEIKSTNWRISVKLTSIGLFPSSTGQRTQSPVSTRKVSKKWKCTQLLHQSLSWSWNQFAWFWVKNKLGPMPKPKFSAEWTFWMFWVSSRQEQWLKNKLKSWKKVT